MKKEKELKEKLDRTSYDSIDVKTKAIHIINLLKWIEGSKIVMSYLRNLKEHSQQLQQAQNNQLQLLTQFQPHIESVIWSTPHLNLQQLKEFNNAIAVHFSPAYLQMAKQEVHVNQRLKELFGSMIPTPKEIQEYLVAFAKRSEIPQENLAKFMDSNAGNGNPYGGGSGGNNYMPANQQPYSQ
jgi:hypothetical protein